NPITYQQNLLPIARLGSLWIWIAAFAFTVLWSRQSYGPRSMTFAAWLFALSPNILAHGGLITMELPLVAATTALIWLFWNFMQPHRRRFFYAAAAVGGLALSCKFTTVLIPPILTIVWFISCWREGEHRPLLLARRILFAMSAFLLLMLVSN